MRFSGSRSSPRTARMSSDRSLTSSGQSRPGPSDMGTTLAIRFPLGRYHANPWDRAVNEGASEWPPSPWRLLRALAATWHTRWPDLPVSVLEGLLDQLGELPSY